jgi:acyl-coenzyme A synthetase/AMP-(fatty) acid ligase
MLKIMINHNFDSIRYNTGDFFSMDKDGKFYFKSRRKELITARGSGICFSCYKFFRKVK